MESRRQFGAVVGDGELRRSGGVAQQSPEDSQGGVTESHDHVRCCGGQLAPESDKILVDPLPDDLSFRGMRSELRRWECMGTSERVVDTFDRSGQRA